MAQVPRSLSDEAQHLVLLGVHEDAVGVARAELPGQGKRDVHGRTLVGEAHRVELLVPPEAALVLEVQAPEVEVQVRSEEVLAVEPHLAAVHEEIGDRLGRVRQQVLLHARAQLGEYGECRVEGVERLGLDALLEEQAIRLLHRLADDRAPHISGGQLVLAAEGERPPRDVDAPRDEGPPLVLAFGQPRAQRVFVGLLGFNGRGCRVHGIGRPGGVRKAERTGQDPIREARASSPCVGGSGGPVHPHRPAAIPDLRWGRAGPPGRTPTGRCGR